MPALKIVFLFTTIFIHSLPLTRRGILVTWKMVEHAEHCANMRSTQAKGNVLNDSSGNGFLHPEDYLCAFFWECVNFRQHLPSRTAREIREMTDDASVIHSKQPTSTMNRQIYTYARKTASRGPFGGWPGIAQNNQPIKRSGIRTISAVTPDGDVCACWHFRHSTRIRQRVVWSPLDIPPNNPARAPPVNLRRGVPCLL